MNLKKIFVKHGTSNSRVKFVFLAEEWGQGYLQGRSQDFSKGGGGGHRGYSPDHHPGKTRVLDENTLQKKQILKKWAFQKWLLRPRYCHGVFAT